MLRTDFKDDVLDLSVNTQRKFSMVDNGDGTVSFSDQTTYTQVGDTYGASEINETNDVVNKSHTQHFHSFAASAFSLVSGGAWDGYYKASKSVTIHNPSGSVRASGTTLSSPPSSDVLKAVSKMFFEIDDTANTLTAYAPKAPTVTIYIAVEGVQ